MDHRRRLDERFRALFGTVSPSADFALVSRYASPHGRRAGIIGALGVGTGMALNTVATVAGIGAALPQH